MAKMRSGARWLNNHYAANDYYSERERVLGEWMGRGAEYLGLTQQSIEGEDRAFLALFSGRTPGGEKLKQRSSGIIGYDFQCSAQKSVSIMAVVGGDDRLVDSHRIAVKEAFRELEGLAAMQRGQGARKHRETTGNLCAAVFHHDASRALDPQLHTHFAVANFTIAENGKRYALETHDMVKAIRYAGKVYQAALRREVIRCGYETIEKRNERGQIEGFEIVGVSDDLLGAYSQRREEIEKAIDGWRAEHGREPSAAEIHVLAKETRSEKLHEISNAEVQAQQRQRISSDDLARLHQLRADAIDRTGQNPDSAQNEARELVERAREHLAERFAVFGEHQLLAEALNRGLGRIDLETLKTSLKQNDQVVPVDNRGGPMRLLTDRANLDRETASVEFINRSQGSRQEINTKFRAFSDCEHLGDKWVRHDAESGKSFDCTEQKRAVETLLRTQDQVFALRGVAGAGKTTAIREFHAGVIEGGRTHFMLAPTRKAVEALTASTGADARTVENFLAAVQNGKVNPIGAVITVDEWGLLSHRSGHQILSIAKQYGADVRFVGDTRQHVAVEAGDFGRTLERHSNLRSAALSRINRQRDPDYNRAVTAMAAGQTLEGIQLLDRKGWIHDAGANYIRSAAARYLEQSGGGKQLVAPGAEPIVLGVAPTHTELRAFTAEVRARLKENGTLGGAVIQREVFQPDDTTKAQRREVVTYRLGLSVVLASGNQKMNGLSAQDVYTVTGITKDFVQLTSRTGERKAVNVKKHGTELEIGNVATIELLRGDRVLFRANSKNIVNGQLATIAGQDERGRLLTTEGLAVPNAYLRISHGYATTSHTAQGVTAQKGVVFGVKFDAKALYVSLSRAKERTDLYTPNKEYLYENAERSSGDRLGALDALDMSRASGSAKRGRSRVVDHRESIGERLTRAFHRSESRQPGKMIHKKEQKGEARTR